MVAGGGCNHQAVLPQPWAVSQCSCWKVPHQKLSYALSAASAAPFGLPLLTAAPPRPCHCVPWVTSLQNLHRKKTKTKQ